MTNPIAHVSIATPPPLPEIVEARADAGRRGSAVGKAVVVHGGARDSYQLAAALSEAGLLEALVTDLFWPQDRLWAKWVLMTLPACWRELALRRSNEVLPSEQVVQHVALGLRGIALERWPGTPLWLRRWSVRAADAALSKAAGRRARKAGTGLVAYSYYGYHAMEEYGAPAMLFQVHPHPASMRRILREELEAHPECAESLQQEWELALPEKDFRRLVEEPRRASHLLVASSFTRDTLIEQGIARENITVVPYGVDLEKFHPAQGRAVSSKAPLQLLFVGRINQRKGILYLLQALRCFAAEEVQLTVCGRVVDGLELFRSLARQVTVRPSVSESALLAAYQAADLFVLPSVGEGFGQVLLEALACGLPIVSTTRTAAPDLIRDGVEGFIGAPGKVEPLVRAIVWALNHRSELEEMHVNARQCAERFTWQRFRAATAAAVRTHLGEEAEEVRR